jgi:hypothetical protein
MLPTSILHEWSIMINALRPAITGENELLVQMTASARSEAEAEVQGADEKKFTGPLHLNPTQISFLNSCDY